MQLLYCSRKARALSGGGLRNLVEDAARRNQQRGISGPLLAGCGLYLQFLEGPHGEVNALWERLQRDRRHAKPELLMKNLRGADRLFPQPALALMQPAAPLQFMALTRDVRQHVNAHAVWYMQPQALAVLVDRSAKRRERRAADE